MKPFRYLPKVLQVLLLANAAVFVIAFLGRGIEVNLGAGYGSLTDYISYFGAFMPRVPLEIWRYVTYMFIHVDFMHFFFNMLMLWMFGSEVAEWMGTRHFVSMYFFCGIFAALFSFFMCLLGLTNNPIIGASGALMGVFVAYSIKNVTDVRLCGEMASNEHFADLLTKSSAVPLCVREHVGHSGQRLPRLRGCRDRLRNRDDGACLRQGCYP